MPHDWAQQCQEFSLSEVDQCYGPNVHIIDDPYLATLLARLSARETKQPAINRLLKTLYGELMRLVIACEFPRRNLRVETRMADHTLDAWLQITGINPKTEAVCVDIARAGMVPSQVCYDILLDLLKPDGVRQDHLMMARTADAEGRVSGVSIHGSKIGGPVDGRVVLFPDPMGATGTSLSNAISVYKREVPGKPLQWITLNLIITPEFVERVLNDHPEVLIYALRLDRGLSPSDVLESTPGEHWDRERGLTDNGYIVPGAGGMGEIINNTDE